jgi:antitoxin (DNA-binding transcriptional repressor) of toxin-antitoxin stability system
MIWQVVPKEQEMVVTNNGKPVALLTPLSDTTLEAAISAVRRAKAMNAVKSMRQKSVEFGNDTMLPQTINTVINRVHLLTSRTRNFLKYIQAARRII